ncbi:MAG: NusG domain II-containing protein [Candidatus Magnetoovum sp. WYHC-5]|nr:NusG domain II-containing protein [Candidatus Magnetoovum sp. WYHC-5]
MNQNEIIKSITFFDIALFIALLAVNLLALVYVTFSYPAGEKVVVEINNKLLYSYTLSVDRVVELKEGITLEIKDDKVRVLWSDCPNKLCMKQGWITKGAIICLPKRIVIKITGSATDKLDGTTG